MTLADAVKPDLAAIDAALAQHLDTDATVAKEICGYLLSKPGKRIRPLLAVLCARLGGDESRSLTLACAVEYLHAATLLHDDIVDGALLRRGQAAAHTIWGQALTILGGDFLLARAVTLVAGLDHGEIMRKFSHFAEAIIAGEIKEIAVKGDLDLAEEDYFDVITGKTACLFQAACESGGHLGGLQPQQIVVLGEYGLNLGLAFQIEDDIMDYTVAADGTGKLRGNDLKERKITLPLILALQKANAQQKARIAEIFAGPEITPEHFTVVYDIIEQHNGFGAAREMVLNYAAQAQNALAGFPESATKTTLKQLAQYAVMPGQVNL